MFGHPSLPKDMTTACSERKFHNTGSFCGHRKRFVKGASLERVDVLRGKVHMLPSNDRAARLAKEHQSIITYGFTDDADVCVYEVAETGLTMTMTMTMTTH